MISTSPVLLATSIRPDGAIPIWSFALSGEMRISNFLLWQISYAEFYVTETFWPDFSPAELEKAVLAYAARNRRFGDINAVKPQ
jgi:hypothetical protein